MNRKINQKVIDNITKRNIVRWISIPLLFTTLKIPIYETQSSYKKRIEKYKELAQYHPVIKDKHGNVVDGFHRQAVARKLGIEINSITIE